MAFVELDPETTTGNFSAERNNCEELINRFSVLQAIPDSGSQRF